MTPTVPPRRPRSPGRRSFSPGTDADWQQALQSPHVQAMLRDPAIMQAALSQSAQPEQQPQRFQAGGIQSGSTDYWDGISEPVLRQLSTNPGFTPQQQAQIQAALQRKQGGATMPPPLNAGGAGIPGISSAQSMAGLKNLETAGAPTVMNTLGPAAAAGLMGLSSTYGKGANVGAGLVGAATAGLLNYMIRRKGQQQKTSGQQIGQMDTTPATSTATNQTAPAANQGSSDSVTTPGTTSLPLPTGSGPGSLMMGQDKNGQNIHSLGGGQWVNDQTGAPAIPANGGAYIGGGDAPIGASVLPAGMDPSLAEIGAYAPQAGMDPSLAEIGAYSGNFARGGEVHSDAAADRAQTLGILKEKKLIKARGGRVSKFAEGGESPLAPPKKGKAILLRKPLEHSMPIPVLHTTIVIEAKPKKRVAKKKKRGGAIKAAALPPKQGPGNGDGPPAPFRKGGHVQVPRGTGAAIRGKRFGGIY